MKRLDHYIRDLAKSDYWQSLYSASKTNHGIQLFENTTNFSNLQVQFIQWLSIYSMLFTELAQHENKYLTEKVLEDFDRTDAYLYMRRKNMETEWKKYQKEKETNEIKSRHSKNKKINNDSEICEINFKG
jgi:hypothetical protein